MKFQLAVAALALLVINVEVGGHPHNMTMTCKGEPVEGKLLWKGKHDCMVKYVPELANMPEDKDEKIKKWKELKGKIHGNECIGVCQKTTIGIYDAAGVYSATGAAAYIDGAFPEVARAAMKTAFQQCATDNMVGKTLTMDNNCADYKPMGDCTKKQFMEICEIKWGKKGPSGDKSASAEA